MPSAGRFRFDPTLDIEPDSLSPEMRRRAVVELLATGLRRLRERGAFDVGSLAASRSELADFAEKTLESCRR